MSHEQDIYIAATGTHLPGHLASVADAVESGEAPENQGDLGYVEVAVAGDVPAVELAIRAGRAALARREADAAEVGLLLHASCSFQGVDLWPTSSYIANNTVGRHAVPIDIMQRCLGGIAATRLAVAWMRAGFASSALVTTADNFAAPYVDRWNQPTDFIFGDAGTAMVLSTTGGVARILGTASNADSAHEGWTRGDTPFALLPGTEQPVRFMDRAIEHAGRADPAAAWQDYESALLRTRDEALAEAKVGLEQITRVVVPNVHRGSDQTENYDVLGFTEEQSLWRDFGRYVGHLGAGDHLAGLNWLLEQRAVHPGDLVLLIGAGAGFTFGAMVVEILAEPTW